MKRNIILASLVIAFLILLAPGSAFGWMPYGYGPPLGGEMPQPKSMRVERSADQDFYTLTLHLSGIAPEQINVAVQGNGRWLNISAEDSNETSETQTSDQNGYYYSRSCSYSSSRTNRRIGLPGDAQVDALQRTDGEDRVTIRIPRAR